MHRLNSTERTGAGLAAGSVLLVGGSVAASSLLTGYPLLGGQAVRYLAAGLLLAAWARLRRHRLPRPAGREWLWLTGLAVVGLAGCSVLMIQATRVADPASVGVVIGAAPLVIVLATAIAAGRRPTGRVLLAAAVVTAGSAAAQLGGGGGLAFSGTGLAWSLGVLAGAAGTSLLAAPVLPRLGALAVTAYACGLAGGLLLAAAAAARVVGGTPILRPPTAAQLGALVYLAVVVTAVVYIAWYAAMGRLGAARTGLFNGLIPIASLAAVALVGTGAIAPVQILAALTVLAGVLLGLGRAPQPSAGWSRSPGGASGDPADERADGDADGQADQGGGELGVEPGRGAEREDDRQRGHQRHDPAEEQPWPQRAHHEQVHQPGGGEGGCGGDQDQGGGVHVPVGAVLVRGQH